MARQEGVTTSTHQKRDLSWDFWLGLLHRINNNNDPYLDKLEAQTKNCACGDFMHAVRRGNFEQKSVQGDTARNNLDHVAAIFVESYRPIPVTDTIGNTHNHADRQTKGYKRLDPSTQHKKALPPIFFENILQQALLPRERAQASLICVALFFATRSCKYTYVGKVERKIRPIRLLLQAVYTRDTFNSFYVLY